MADFGAQSDEESAANTPSVATISQMVRSLGVLEEGIQSGDVLNTIGGTERLLIGASNSTDADRSGLQNVLRAGAEYLNPDISARQTARNFLMSKDYINAYDSLRGAGQITEFEARTAANAETIFSQQDAPAEELQIEIDRAQSIIDFGGFRSNEGIQIDENGLETLTDENGNTRNVLTFRDESGNPQYREVPEGRTVYNIPDYLPQETAKAMTARLPSGSEYFYQGQIYNRDNM